MFHSFASAASRQARANVSAAVAVAAVALFATAAVSTVSAQETKPAKAEIKIIVTVDGAPITTLDLAQASEALGPRLTRVPQEMRQRVLMDLMIDRAMFSKAAKAAKVMDMEAFKTQMDYYTKDALRDVYVSEVLGAQITPEAVRARYDAEVAKQPKVDEIRARHILLKTEDEAKDIVKQLKDGGDFVALAKDKSIGPSASRGGDLGFFVAESMVPEFAAAVKALEIGKISDPVKSQFGWHVIKVEEKRVREAPPFERIAPNLRELLLSEKVREEAAVMRKAAVVDYKDPAFKPKGN